MSQQDRALVRNAADPQQVKRAERKERDRADRFTGALKAVMGTPDGRFVMWTLLSKAGIYRSIWDPSSKIHYLAGRQDFGHELLDLLLRTDDEAYLLMEREARASDKRDARENDAAHIARADDGGTV